MKWPICLTIINFCCARMVFIKNFLKITDFLPVRQQACHWYQAERTILKGEYWEDNIERTILKRKYWKENIERRILRAILQDSSTTEIECLCLKFIEIAELDKERSRWRNLFPIVESSMSLCKTQEACFADISPKCLCIGVFQNVPVLKCPYIKVTSHKKNFQNLQ